MMKIVTIAILVLFLVVLPAVGVYFLFKPEPRFVVRADLDTSQSLASPDGAGFARVLQPRDFSFPQDHGPHPDYGVEWWYYTGNLDSPEGRHFGFELTLFRIGLAADKSERASDWATSQIYMGHFAVTDVENDRFYAFERFSRQALGLAGASAIDDQGFRVWLDDWSIEGSGATVPTVRLRAAEEDISIDLTLVSDKPLVLQGERGFSQKSAKPGNASYYYSVTRMATTGKVSIGNESFTVEGASWMDREWSTSTLSEEQVGWDWFALQLSDGRDLMYYQLLLEDGDIDSLSSGTIVSGDGSTRSLSPREVDISVLDYWESPRGGSYPAKWRLQVPAQSIDVEVTPYIKDQELDVSVRYWEGAVKIEGMSQGRPVAGVGYVEMARSNNRNSAYERAVPRG